MMKLFTMLLLSVFLGKSCTSQTNSDLKNAVLEYTATTRGFYQKITIENQMVTTSKDRNGTDKPVANAISDADWKELVSYFEVLKLDSLATLKAPSKKRLHDGAAIANLKVNYKGKIYQTDSFDHGNPPESIKNIVDKLNTFVKKNNEH